MAKSEKIIDGVMSQLKGYDVEKIYWDKNNGKVLVVTKPRNGVDGIYIFENTLDDYRLFSPTENIPMYKDITNEDNLIYEKDSLKHSSNDFKYYNKIDNYYPDGSTRYFYTQAEWEAYEEGRKRTEYEKQQKAKKEAEKKAGMTGYNEWNKANSTPGKAYDNADDNKGNSSGSSHEPGVVDVSEAIKALKGEHPDVFDAQKGREWDIKNSVSATIPNSTPSELAETMKQILANSTNKVVDSSQNQRDVDAQKSKENTIKAEEERQKAIEAEKNRVTNYLKDDPNSPIAKMESVKDFVDGLDEHIPSNEELMDNDRMIQETYEWIEENRATEEIDPETGLYLKNYNIAIEDEIRLVNPGFYYSNQNEVVSYTVSDAEYFRRYYADPSMLDYGMNCYACTTAMALRMQGYDVVAGKDNDGVSTDGIDSDLGTSWDKLWSGSFSELDYQSETSRKIASEPAGSYGDFNLFVWNKDGTAYGHSIFYMVDEKGHVHYYDCQNGTEYSQQYIRDLGKDAKKDWNGKPSYYTRYKRLDNQTFKGVDVMKSTKTIGDTNNKKGDKTNEEKRNKSKENN